MSEDTDAMSPEQIESTLVFDTNERYPRDDRRTLAAEGIHECGERKVRIEYSLFIENSAHLHAQRYFIVDGEQRNEHRSEWEVSAGDAGYTVDHNGQELNEFITDNFQADPEIELTDAFEDMVDL
jgi:hypothetical protein